MNLAYSDSECSPPTAGAGYPVNGPRPRVALGVIMDLLAVSSVFAATVPASQGWWPGSDLAAQHLEVVLGQV